MGHVYGEVNQQHRAMGQRQRHVDRRLVAAHRGAFDRRSDRAAEPSHWLCGACGALVPPRTGDPHRDAVVLPDPCVHCGSSAWVDLTDDDATRGVASVEAYELATVDRSRRVRGWSIRLGGALGMLAICFFAIANSYSAIFSALTCVVCLIAVPYFLLGYGHATRVERRALPYRWVLPLPPSATAKRDGLRLEGVVTAASPESLVAPLSRRACLGYRVVVRRGGAPSHAAAALVAQDSVDLSVDGRRVARDSVRLDLDPDPVVLDEARRSAAVAYLRRHGVFEVENRWILTEAVLIAGTRVVVAAADHHGAILTRA